MGDPRAKQPFVVPKLPAGTNQLRINFSVDRTVVPDNDFDNRAREWLRSKDNPLPQIPGIAVEEADLREAADDKAIADIMGESGLLGKSGLKKDYEKLKQAFKDQTAPLSITLEGKPIESEKDFFRLVAAYACDLKGAKDSQCELKVTAYAVRHTEAGFISSAKDEVLAHIGSTDVSLLNDTMHTLEIAMGQMYAVGTDKDQIEPLRVGNSYLGQQFNTPGEVEPKRQKISR